MTNAQLKPYLKRLLVIAAISLAFVIAFNEITFLFQKEKYDRAPQTVQIEIPPGTAASVENGEDPISLPDEMVFVLGDVLEVVNHDVVSHQLGPIWVPAGSSAKLNLQRAEKYAFTCSFKTDRYLNLDVKQPTTLTTRLTALGLSFPTMTSLLFIYSLLVYPLKKSDSPVEEGAKA